VFHDDHAAELYDLLYQDRKNYAAEAARVTGLIRERSPGARSLLDVACGTGLHLATLSDDFDEVAGLELARPMLDRAARRLPGVPLHHTDMRGFDLGRRFDAVVSLFSAVGYLETAADLRAAIASMAAHLSDGGVLVVEPWYFPDTFLPGHVSAHAVRDGAGGRGIARVARSTVEGNRTRIEIHYLLGDPETGVRHHTDVDRLTLFSRTEYTGAFHACGLDVEYLDTGDGGPGFLVGQRRTEPETDG
jgi:SAM-dependent methyltransferase